MRRTLLAVAAVAALAASPTNAAIITKTFNFDLSGFHDINSAVPVAPPVATASGSFTVNFDPAVTYINNTADITLNFFSGPTVDSALGFTYSAANHFFWFGGIENNAHFVVTGTNDFVLTLDLTDIDDPRFVTCGDPGIVCGASTGNADIGASGYTATSSGTALWFISVPESEVSVPEPASLALLGVALLGAGVSRRRQRSR